MPVNDRPSQSAEQIARAYLEALGHRDKDAILPLLTDDFVLEIPHNTSGTNDLKENWRGIEEAASKYEGAFTRIVSAKFHEIEITPTENPNIVFAEAVGEMTASSGRPYNNRYAFRFDLQDGKIKRIREYRNPITAAIAFGRPLPTT